MKTVLMMVIVVGACGGSKPAATTHDETDVRNRQMGQMGGKHQMGHKGEKKEGGMAAASPELARFHDTLAPRWHAAHGSQRMTDTCDAILRFHREAEAIAAARAPGKADASAWSTGGRKLTEAVVALDSTCRSKDAAAFEPAFQRVHEIFHGLMEAAGGHEEHGKGEHDDDKDEYGDKNDEHGEGEHEEHAKDDKKDGDKHH
jgi:hypothetical protein